jgi:hypothetical protein
MRYFKPLSRRTQRPFARYGQEMANVIPVHHLRGADSIMSDQGYVQESDGSIIRDSVRMMFVSA